MTGPDPSRQRVVTLSIDVFLTIVLLSIFLWLCSRVVAPFVSTLVWSVILAVALYPVYTWMKARVGSGGLAATIMAVLGLLLIVGPTIALVHALTGSVGELAAFLAEGKLHVPAPPDSIREWPLIGERLYLAWATASENLLAFAAPYEEQIRSFSRVLLGAGAGLVLGALQFVLSVIFAAVFMVWGAELSEGTASVVERLTARGRAMVDMALRTLRNVSLGVLGVAVIQGGLGAIGIMLMGLPFAGFLSALLVGASMVQLPPLVILPVIGLAWALEPTTPAIVFTVWMLFVMLIDNVLKPVLMARGLKTPMVVILIGVIGGTLSGGLVGLFIGPVLLALFHDLAKTWLEYTRDPVSGEADVGAPPTAEG